MNEMIERVKAAIAEQFAPAIDFKAPYAKVMLDMAAKAAIAAMREPTEAMIAAGGAKLEESYRGDGRYVPDQAAVWRVMIDEMLKPSPSSHSPPGE